MKRYKVTMACNACRLRKLKCDGIRPACGRCQKKDELRQNCRYSTRADTRISPISHTFAAATGPSPHPPASSSSALLQKAEPSDGVEATGVYTSPNPGGFACEVKAAVDARLGLPVIKKHCPIPMIDAPLFGSLSRRQTVDDSLLHVDNVLPPRKHADHLMDIYWRHIQPLEPILDEDRFSRSYQALFTGGDLEADERIFISTLNTVFALSTQRQESTQPEQREDAGKTFFHRAWSLLRPETILWEPGSLELVQCLLLMSRFLQCTNNPLQTWMAVGSAVRIAQSLSLHIPDPPSPGVSSRDSLLRRQVWLELSWILGRASMVPLTGSSPAIDSLYDDSTLERGCYSFKVLELQEITSHVMLSQMPVSSRFAESIGLPRLCQGSDLNTAVQFDASLNRWEKNLPPSLRSANANANDYPVEDGADSGLVSQRTLLHLRLAHTRTLLFRPMLAHFCLSQPQPSADQSLGYRILQDCASLCVENSRKIIALINDNFDSGDAIGPVPWWHRIFYLYVASQHLIAAMLRPDVFTAMASDSLRRALSILQGHEHLSPCVGRCIKSFQTLSQKIADIHHHPTTAAGTGGDGVQAVEGQASFPNLNLNFQDVFQGLGFEADNSSLLGMGMGMEDMSWLGPEGWNV
ncbi:hypothetical protein QBC46DRAFT_292403 [Diplogelasinospora grovesii]|uniref:Zn(2)-C6 fungal-type domain-containing protein n=1 Tax=Diplogelasinospora grovesii TaxID=303347 RepID=A0AAN6N3F3_9PEZI|nr:hypothetical protein QBC46DRAFT_292403 [Diplogelasinospora grovesii]